MTRSYTIVFTLFFLILLSNTGIWCQSAGKLYTERLSKAEISHDGFIYQVIEKEYLSDNLKQQFISRGILLKGDYPNGISILSIPESEFEFVSSNLGANFSSIDNSFKISDEIAHSEITPIVITFHDKLSIEAINQIKSTFQITENDFSIDNPQMLIGNIEGSKIDDLATLSEVAYIGALVEEPEPLNDVLTSFHHAGFATNDLGLDLKGEGMVVGLGDGGKLGEHIDLEGRVININQGTYASYGAHADNMAGIIAGAGSINEKYKGYAPKATLITEKSYRIFYFLENFYTNYGMRITNNSYGTSFTCNNAGAYDNFSTVMDQQMVDYEDVIHIVAAGNNGTTTCNDYPQGYHTVLKTYASSKNVLTVGAVNLDKTLNSISAQGPVKDGRLKPEITALSQGITTTGNNNNYGAISGTSAATANVTGATTLVYERYKELNNNNPEGALIKSIMCNSADDTGNPGPDFKYGYGIMNVQQAIEIVDDGNYFLGETTEQNSEQTFTIDVAQGQSELKVLLAWSDVPQVTYNSAALINDLDLTIVTPDGTEFQAWILDPSAANVTNDAVRGVDRLNNTEQVTIPSPIQGSYTIKVNTYNLDTPIQKYAISYLTKEEGISVTYPVEGMTFNRNEKVQISWDSSLPSPVGYQIDYSSDGGTTWENIGSALADEQTFEWTAPDIFSENVLIRIKETGSSVEENSELFNILRIPTNFSASPLCSGYINLAWTHEGTAEKYNLYMFDGLEMTKIGETEGNEYLVEKTMIDGKDYWFSVQAVYPSGNVSKRAIAENTTTNGIYPCPWNNDIEISSINAGADRGRELTSQSLSDNATLQVELLNAGTNSVSGIDLYIRINGVEIMETVNEIIGSGEMYTYTTTNTFDFSSVGEYDIEVEAVLLDDIHSGIRQSNLVHCTQLENQPLAIPSIEKMESINDFNIANSFFGIPEYPTLDFYKEENSIAYITLKESGNERGLVLNGYNNSVIENSEMIFTKNLAGVNNLFLKLDYKLKSPNIISFDNKVVLEMRGSDTDNWMHITDLDHENDWIEEPQVLNVSKLLYDANQEFSTSTQFRFTLVGLVAFDLEEMSFSESIGLLPVELVSFDATRIEENTLLEWVTASEENNDYFEVQVAVGSGEYFTLDRIEGQGTTADETTYFYNDTEKFKSGIRYYRLKQVDYDGAYTYTEVIPVFFEEQEKIDFRVYPNPIISGYNPNVYINLGMGGEVKFLLSDATGKILRHYSEMMDAGPTNFQFEVDPNLNPGIYYLRVEWGTRNNITTKIIKVND